MNKKHIKKENSSYFRIFLKIITNNIKSVRNAFSKNINLQILFSNFFTVEFLNYSSGRCYYFIPINFFKGATYSIEYREKKIDGRIIGSKFGSHSCEICFHDGK